MNEAIYDFALRLNGLAIGFSGKHGLTFPEEAFLKRFLPKVRSGVLMDVGANHGTYSQFLEELRPDLRVLAFEPHPRSFELLKQNTKDGKVEQFNMALSDSNGTMKLYDFASKDGSTQASLSLDAVQLFDSAAVSYDVKVQTLDQFCEEKGIDRIAFLKIDTEGFISMSFAGRAASWAKGKSTQSSLNSFRPASSPGSRCGIFSRNFPDMTCIAFA